MRAKTVEAARRYRALRSDGGPYPPCGRLYGELVGRYPGPILVIGGGPSATGDLLELSRIGFKPAAVVSANEHGHHQSLFPVTFTVCSDGVHHAKRMRLDRLLAPFNTKIIGPSFFADYRLPNWSCAANTGLVAIAVAAGLGGSPVVVTGLDFFRMTNPAAATYFHDPGAKSNSNSKAESNFRKQIGAMQAKMGTQAVRPMSGPLLSHYPRFALDEITPPSQGFEYARFCYRMPTHVVRSHRSLRWPLDGMQVDRGREIACSPLESLAATNARQCELLHIIDSPLDRDLKAGKQALFSADGLT